MFQKDHRYTLITPEISPSACTPSVCVPYWFFHWILLMRVLGLTLWLCLPLFGLCRCANVQWMYLQCVYFYYSLGLNHCSFPIFVEYTSLTMHYSICNLMPLEEQYSLYCLCCSSLKYNSYYFPSFLPSHIFSCSFFLSFLQLRRFANYRLGILGRAVHPVGSSQLCAFVLLPLDA